MEQPNPSLAVIDNSQLSLPDRVRRLKAEAEALVMKEAVDLAIMLENAANLAGSIIEAGDSCSPGVRELCRTIQDDLERKAKALSGFVSRT